MRSEKDVQGLLHIDMDEDLDNKDDKKKTVIGKQTSKI